MLSPGPLMQRDKEQATKRQSSRSPHLGTKGEFMRGFLPSSTTGPMGNAAQKDPEERPQPRPLAPREALGLPLSGSAPLHRQPPHLPLALLHISGTCHQINRKGCCLLGVPRMLPHGLTLPTPEQVPEHPWATFYTPFSHLCPLGKQSSGLTCKLSSQLG